MKKKQFPLSLLLLLTAACTSENAELLPQPSDAPDVLRIASVGMDDGKNTRGIMDNTGIQTNGCQIGVYAVNSDNTEYIPLHGGSNASVYQYNNSCWNVTSMDGSKLLRLPTNGNSCKIYAYYPSGLVPVYQAAGGSYLSGINVVAQDDFSSTTQKDYLYPSVAATTNINSFSGVSFTLKHALAKLTFKVYKLAVMTEEIKLTKLQIIANANTLQVGSGKTMLLSSGNLQGLVGTDLITLAASDGGMALPAQTNTINLGNPKSTVFPFCLVAPAPNVDYLSFQLTVVSNKQEQTYLTQQIKMTSHWAAGNHFVFTLVLNGMNAIISGMKQYQWEGYTETDIPIS